MFSIRWLFDVMRKRWIVKSSRNNDGRTTTRMQHFDTSHISASTKSTASYQGVVRLCVHFMEIFW
jgi:hypothetical protein